MQNVKLYELSYSYPKYTVESHIVYSSFFLGVFSTFDKVEKAIGYYSSVSGFSKDPDRFFIRPFCVDNAANVVYQVGISYIAQNENDDIEEILAYCKDENEAKTAARLSQFYDEFKDYFVIEPVKIDKMEWVEGFTSEMIR